ncbi:thymidylate synthase [Oceanobacillus luteolus]|uniref:thymidylate synthase n=1 Tax=Oceanobacillus luteolus TaxID=1274358 RepID=A0ABW4HUX3_9BACI
MYLMGDSIDDIYYDLAQNIMNNGEIVVARGAETKELRNVTITIKDPSKLLLLNAKRNISLKYAFGELFWYLSGSDELNFISHYAKSYGKYSDDGVRLNGAYGPRIIEQIEKIQELLTHDPNSRRAVISIYHDLELSLNSKDIPCTLNLQFLIRDNKLHLITTMRSNDLYLGFPYDLFSFGMIQRWLALKLNTELGTYTHFIGSVHIYKKHYDFFKSLDNTITENKLQNINIGNILNNIPLALEVERLTRTGKVHDNYLNNLDKDFRMLSKILK